METTAYRKAAQMIENLGEDIEKKSIPKTENLD